MHYALVLSGTRSMAIRINASNSYSVLEPNMGNFCLQSTFSISFSCFNFFLLLINFCFLLSNFLANVSRT